MSTAARSTTPETYALEVIAPSSRDETEQAVDLTQVMRGLAIDRSSPIALELARTEHGRHFLIRARDGATLHSVERQIRARIPQADFRLLSHDDDPLVLHPGEAVSMCELTTALPSYLPLHMPSQDHEQKAESDPLLGVLGALDALPENMRAICQLVIIPASPLWSARFRRRALEHPLEPERQRAQMQMLLARYGGNMSGGFVFIVLLLLLWLIFGGSRLLMFIPVWIRDAFATLFRGQLPHLNAEQSLLFYGSGILLLGGVIGLISCIIPLTQRWQARSLYDIEAVKEHIGKAAYRARLRLLVIGPAAPAANTAAMQNASPQHQPQTHVFGGRGAMPPARFFSMVGHWGMHLLKFLHHLSRSIGTWGLCLVQHMHAASAARHARREALTRLQSAYRQLSQASGNYFRARYCSGRRARARMLVYERPRFRSTASWHTSWWRGVHASSLLLTVDTLAALWHLPAASVLPELARMEHRAMRTRLLPPELIEVSRHLPAMGYSQHAGHRTPFSIPPQCLHQHMLIAGKSGEGKSTAMEHIATAAMQHEGLLVVDPHGDLVEHVLRLVPPHRVNDVILIDLADVTHSIALNPLDATSVGRGRDKAISDLLKTLSQIWASAWGSRMEIAFEYALRTLYEANRRLIQRDPMHGPGKQYTLLDVMTLLTDESFCEALVQDIEDHFIRRWWASYFDPLSDTMQRERVDPVLSKVAKFESQIARRIIGQSQSSINFLKHIQDEKILLVKLAKGEVGEDVARLLGATFLGLLQIALQEQAEGARKRMGIMVDEFQVLKGVDWAALAEIRKYGAAFYLATQSLDYIEAVHPTLLPTILSNVKQYLCFYLSAQDAEVLAPELGVEPKDILNLDSHHCYLKLTYAQRRQPVFSASFSLLAPTEEGRRVAQIIRDQSRARYAQPAHAIDERIMESLVRALSAHPTRKHLRDDQKRKKGAGQQTPGRARQDGGYRGRKGQEEAPKPSAHAKPMSWTETGGTTAENGGEKEDGE